MHSSLTAAVFPLLALVKAEVTTVWATKTVTVSVCPSQVGLSQDAAGPSVFSTSTRYAFSSVQGANPPSSSAVWVESVAPGISYSQAVAEELYTSSEAGIETPANTQVASNVVATGLEAVYTSVPAITTTNSVPYSYHNTTAAAAFSQHASGAVGMSTLTSEACVSQNVGESGFSTATVLSCPDGSSGNSTVYLTTTAEGAAVSVVYVTPSPVIVYTTTTITSSSIVPTSPGWLAVLDTTSTVYPGANASAYSPMEPGGGFTKREVPAVPCTKFVTLVAVQSGATTSTLPQQTVTNTSTSMVTVPSYAACGASNLVSHDPVTGVVIDDVGPLSSPTASNHTYLTNWTTAYDCCARCIEEPNCATSAFTPDWSVYDVETEILTYTNVCILTYWDTCDIAGNQEQWVAGTDANYTYTVSNGNCGFLSRYVVPRCTYVYRDNAVECDLDCDGVKETHLTWAEWEAQPVLPDCPVVAAAA